MNYDFSLVSGGLGKEDKNIESPKKQKPKKASITKKSDAKNLPAISVADLEQAKAALCKKSFYAFVQEFWDTIIPEKPVWNWHIKYLCDELQEIGFRLARREKKKSDVIINVPPGTSKSTIVSIMFPVWLWVIDPTIKIISGSYAKDIATGLSTKSRDIIKSDKFLKWYPTIQLKEDQSGKTNFENTNGGARITTSTGSAITGSHAHLIIVDDPTNPLQAASETERDIANTWVSETLSSRKVDSEVTVTILVQQRLHVEDTTGYLLDKGKHYQHICLPAQLNATIKPQILAENYIDGLLDPVRLSNEVLEEKKTDMGTRSFNTQYDQLMQSEEESIIKESWFSYVSPEEYRELTAKNAPIINFYIDTAYKETKKSDYSAIISVAKIGELLYITNVSHEKKEFPKLIEYIKNWTLANGYSNRSRINIEAKASGLSVTQFLKTQTPFNVIEGKFIRSGKIERLNAISPKVEGGKVVLVKGKWNNMFLSEVTANYPAHDDMRDCFVQAVEGNLMKSVNYGKYNIF
jgi:predicted phage terminase large subunit-like protein